MNDETRRYEPSSSLPFGKVTLPESLQYVDVETSLDGLVNQERALTRYLCFSSWQALLAFMLEGLELEVPDTG